ncbi:methylated-DNA--[protein]-cysteine S-methyltransferase [Bacillus pseudomycoides]|uniref:methylated-DNA--[protein]-cysteine S-methyltransferase n=1 Tax=Bacillus pseudomycoides TaxID=64104 RepID=UPI000BF22ACE|nr:methylated-DNA--[protein]-cysteine S-methyltransferase [Bacillus pseudomycoides]PEJ25029.1 cysteine methyltransferase [Bacillus pseudomycoides]PGE94440.1 cysteine methyltransferase [Bacillus pseudomycoides]PHA87791.1 cysteine methyltransferase [Bacillus pseudomycoides]PHC76116.1 cysteine methyltransferase [Bacillus pseudomycoides]PHE29852.1 cysteine methyltransferase [Bacillus pseudomycoides]
MEAKTNQIIYWTLFVHENWHMYIAATSTGLCFVGSQHQAFEELATWTKKRFPKHTFVQEPLKLEPYVQELVEYLKKQREVFTCPIDVHGTPFQLTVWNTLREIPYGKTYSYSDIAQLIQKPKSARAVGTAIGANPLLITIPCHRVIGNNGKLSGFRGGLAMKKELLTLEKILL